MGGGNDFINKHFRPPPTPDIDAPPPPPDVTDELVQRAQSAARRRLLMGDSLSSSFLTGPLGDTTKIGT